jgi:hypothetical protein
MILEIFITLLCLTFAIIFLSYIIEEGLVLKVTGYLFLFSLGVVLLTGNLEVETGGSVINDGTGTYITKSYEVYENFTFGFYMALAGILGFIMTYTEWDNKKTLGMEDD